MNTAAGPSTRNGAARRATASAPSARSVTRTAGAVVAAIRVTTSPAAKSPPSPSRTSATKNSSAPGGWPATWVTQLSVGEIRDPVDELRRAWPARRRRRGRSEVLVAVCRAPARSRLGRRPVRARAARPAPRRTTTSSRRRQRQPAPPGRRRTATPRAASTQRRHACRARAAWVPRVRAAAARAPAGSDGRARPSRSARGTTTAASTSSRAAPSPTHGCGARATGCPRVTCGRGHAREPRSGDRPYRCSGR